MNREECERTIIGLIQAAKTVYKAYAPDGDYLAMVIVGDTVLINNRFYDKDAETPIYALMNGDDFESLECEGEDENV